MVILVHGDIGEKIMHLVVFAKSSILVQHIRVYVLHILYCSVIAMQIWPEDDYRKHKDDKLSGCIRRECLLKRSGVNLAATTLLSAG